MKTKEYGIRKIRVVRQKQMDKWETLAVLLTEGNVSDEFTSQSYEEAKKMFDELTDIPTTPVSVCDKWLYQSFILYEKVMEDGNVVSFKTLKPFITYF